LKARIFESSFVGKPLKVEIGQMAVLANGSCLVGYGDTAVLVANKAGLKNSRFQI